MKKLVTLLLAFAVVSLLTACTDGGNVSDRTDGMISESTTTTERRTESASTARPDMTTPAVTGSDASGLPGSSESSGNIPTTDNVTDTIGGTESAESAPSARTAKGTPYRY